MKIRLLALLMLFIVISCSVFSTPPLGEADFPLERIAEIHITDKVEQIAVAKTWVAVATPDDLLAFDLATRTALWELKFSIASWTPSLYLIDDTLIAVSSDRILVLDKSGIQREIAITPNNGSILSVVAVSPEYLFVIRNSSPTWVLESYDVSRNSLLWQFPVGRAITDIAYDTSKNFAYVATDDSIITFDNRSGEIIFERELDQAQGLLNYGHILYVYQAADSEGEQKISAVNLDTQKEIWSSNLKVPSSQPITMMTIEEDQLILNGRDGLTALSMTTGQQTWETFVGESISSRPPVEVDGILYAMGEHSQTVFAFSANDGSLIGTANPHEDSLFGEAAWLSGVYGISNEIVFGSRSSILIYGPDE